MRATYNALKRKFNVGKSSVIITPGYLRSEQVLSTQNQINFPILVNEGTAPRSTERRLGISDAFVITDLGIRIGRLTGAGVQLTPGPIQLESFMNPAIFTVAAEQAALNTMYNGFLSVKVGYHVHRSVGPVALRARWSSATRDDVVHRVHLRRK